MNGKEAVVAAIRASGEKLTERQLEALQMMLDDDEEMVCDGNECWVGLERFSTRTEHALLCAVAIKDISDTKGGRRYVINETGREILAKKIGKEG